MNDSIRLTQAGTKSPAKAVSSSKYKSSSSSSKVSMEKVSCSGGVLLGSMRVCVGGVVVADGGGVICMDGGVVWS